MAGRIKVEADDEVLVVGERQLDPREKFSSIKARVKIEETADKNPTEDAISVIYELDEDDEDYLTAMDEEVPPDNGDEDDDDDDIYMKVEDDEDDDKASDWEYIDSIRRQGDSPEAEHIKLEGEPVTGEPSELESVGSGGGNHQEDRMRRTLVVGSLPDCVDDDQLRQLFERFGRVEECSVRKRSSPEVGNVGAPVSAGWGTVKFADASDAARAVEKVDGLEAAGGLVLWVKPLDLALLHASRPTPTSRPSTFGQNSSSSEGAPELGRPSDEEGKTLFVRYLPDCVDDDRLRQLFERFGQLEECSVRKLRLCKDKAVHPVKGDQPNSEGVLIPAGWGTVKFANASDAARAASMVNGFQIAGKTLAVAPSNPAATIGGTCKVVVSNLQAPSTSSGRAWRSSASCQVSEAQMKRVFMKYGPVLDVKIVGTKAFVVLANRAKASEAVAALDGKLLGGSRIKVQMDSKFLKRKKLLAYLDYYAEAVSEEQQSSAAAGPPPPNGSGGLSEPRDRKLVTVPRAILRKRFRNGRILKFNNDSIVIKKKPVKDRLGLKKTF